MERRRGYNPEMAASNIAKLPVRCAAVNPTDKTPIIIMRGEEGYFPMPGLMVKLFNNRSGVTANQVEAMITGSMFGWDVPGANVDNCDGRTAKEFV